MTGNALASAELPDGWGYAPLMDLCELIRGVSYERPEVRLEPTAGYVPLLRANNIGSGLELRDLQYVPEFRVSAAQRLRTGDVVIAMSSGSKSVVGKAASVKEPWCGTFGAFCGVLRPAVSIDHQYFGLFFQTRSYRERISQASAGVNINNLKREYFEAFDFPLPPLTEQQRIVSVVEVLFQRVEAARHHLARVPEIMKRFRQQVLAAACSGALTTDWRMCAEAENSTPSGLPDGWAWKTIHSLASSEPRSIQSGPFGSNLLHSEFQSTGILAIGIDNVQDGYFSLGREHRISLEKYEELQKYQARPLDLLTTVMATVGRCCLVPEELETAIITKHVYRITLDQSVINPAFALLAFRSPGTQDQLSELNRGVTRPGINGEILRTIKLPTPSLREQDEIVRRVKALFDLAERVEQRVAAAQAHADRLTQAILSRAFRGELVPTEAELARREGREYEPASVLLERIWEDRGAAPDANGRASCKGRLNRTTPGRKKTLKSGTLSSSGGD